MHVCLVAMAIALAACSGNDKNQLGDLPVVAHSVEVDGQKMTVCDLSLLKDTIDLLYEHLAQMGITRLISKVVIYNYLPAISATTTPHIYLLNDTVARSINRHSVVG